ncbi:ImmA/IrrE family metallo-endopeptidase [Botrimarina hoheduenensis]|uniref:IrrE N-terminal-like domain-containing protein n=1 Tax=Botrimarina hoheduenensis TaxID=2528000 RepID=A0A5C5VZV8_9BACT|nr:ImmA/IrrE family metallo-endopeptidase [Botrimarina hoheduenensis]TWT43455.1 hypothetical protein Pla111_24060 [Botrimarina hoheduenensis]
MTKMEWLARQSRLDKAGALADDIVSVEKLTAPIDPHDIIRSERAFLRARGANLGDKYDGMLEYHRPKNRFLLYYNTKYDGPDKHHPRTRFSICHELGHYFIDRHRAYLMSERGTSHGSHAEFTSDNLIEREADAFAASMLLPTSQAKPVINKHALSMERIYEIARQFDTSAICTAFRAVRLSHFPCAVAGIRDSVVRWMVPSQPLIDYQIYPRKGHLPRTAQPLWSEFQMGIMESVQSESAVSDWFQVFNDRYADIYVTEEFVPIGTMNTVLVLLTMDEDDFEEDEECEAD